MNSLTLLVPLKTSVPSMVLGVSKRILIRDLSLVLNPQKHLVSQFQSLTSSQIPNWGHSLFSLSADIKWTSRVKSLESKRTKYGRPSKGDIRSVQKRCLRLQIVRRKYKGTNASTVTWVSRSLCNSEVTCPGRIQEWASHTIIKWMSAEEEKSKENILS